jgi:S1-C subfamily serine protease
MDVSTVKPGGAFAKAGFKIGDIFLDLHERHSISELYELLENSRGKTITLRVVPGGNGPPLEQRPVRSIRLKVPSRG